MQSGGTATCEGNPYNYVCKADKDSPGGGIPYCPPNTYSQCTNNNGVMSAACHVAEGVTKPMLCTQVPTAACNTCMAAKCGSSSSSDSTSSTSSSSTSGRMVRCWNVVTKTDRGIIRDIDCNKKYEVGYFLKTFDLMTDPTGFEMKFTTKGYDEDGDGEVEPGEECGLPVKCAVTGCDTSSPPVGPSPGPSPSPSPSPTTFLPDPDPSNPICPTDVLIIP